MTVEQIFFQAWTGQEMPIAFYKKLDIIDQAKDPYSHDEPPYYNFCVEINPGGGKINDGNGDVMCEVDEAEGLWSACTKLAKQSVKSYIQWLMDKCNPYPKHIRELPCETLLEIVGESLRDISLESDQERRTHLSMAFLEQGLFFDDQGNIAPSIDFMSSNEQCLFMDVETISNLTPPEGIRYLLIESKGELALFCIDEGVKCLWVA